MPKALGYIRVSSERQAQTGLGLDAQKEQITKFYEYKYKPLGYEWGGFFDDPATSAGVAFGQRPGGVKLMIHADPGDVVIVAKLDRAFRNVRDCLETLARWKDMKVTAHFLDLSIDTSTAVGMLFLQIVAAFAEWERNRMGERVREAMAQKRAKGQPTNNSNKYGYKRAGPVGKRIYVRDDHTRTIGAKIVEFVEAGWSFERIYIHFIEQRIKCYGLEVSPKKVERFYKGEIKLRELERMEAERRAQHTYPKKEETNNEPS